MIIEKVGLGVRAGKTTQALSLVIKFLKEGKKVSYVTNELTGEGVKDFIERLESGIDLTNFAVYMADKESLEFLCDTMPKDFVVVVDVIQDIEELNCEQDMYVFYQPKTVIS